jgi:hypothetical protein
MLTLVAAVLAYERPASEAAERSSGLVGLRYAMSDTSDENDMTAMWYGSSVERRRE